MERIENEKIKGVHKHMHTQATSWSDTESVHRDTDSKMIL
jgi:hypothetical protein